jgi:SAM-dependent methyltransferase
MFSQTASLYDVIYGQFKKYPEESATLAALLQEVCPRAKRLLDVGCGTGEHARILSDQHGYAVDGIDLEPGFVQIAQHKNPLGQFYCADMADFSIPQQYDAILCLFSSIGYLLTLDRIRDALGRFREHLAPGGVVLVEPWFQPSVWKPGTVHAHLAERDGLKVCRMGHSTTRDRVSVLEFHYLIGDSRGVEHRREVHELGLFTSDELRQAFADAGLAIVRHDPVGLIGRGLFVAAAA